MEAAPIADVVVSQSQNLKIISCDCESIFKVFQPMWSQYLNITDAQTDGQPTMEQPPSV